MTNNMFARTIAEALAQHLSAGQLAKFAGVAAVLERRHFLLLLDAMQRVAGAPPPFDSLGDMAQATRNVATAVHDQSLAIVDLAAADAIARVILATALDPDQRVARETKGLDVR